MMASPHRRPILNSRNDYLRELDIARADAWALARQCERQAAEVQKYADRCAALEARCALLATAIATLRRPWRAGHRLVSACQELLARIETDGHNVVSLTGYAEHGRCVRNVYHIQINDGLFAVATLADYERILAMRVEPEPVQLGLCGEAV